MKRTLLVLLAMAATLPRSARAAPSPAQAASAKTEVTWYGHAAFVLKTPGGTVVAIDPWFSNPLAKEQNLQPPAKIDFILVTHGHGDHVGDALTVGKARGARLIAANELGTALAGAGYPPELITSGNVGGTIKLDDEVSVTLVPAVHSSGFRRDAKSAPEYAGPPAGYFIHVKNGPRLYHTGDTAAFLDIEHAARRWPIDVMLACIGGRSTMDPTDAALHASWVRPKVVVPMHFGTSERLPGRPAELEAALARQGSGARMIEMKVGETRTF